MVLVSCRLVLQVACKGGLYEESERSKALRSSVVCCCSVVLGLSVSSYWVGEAKSCEADMVMSYGSERKRSGVGSVADEGCAARHLIMRRDDRNCSDGKRSIWNQGVMGDGSPRLD